MPIAFGGRNAMTQAGPQEREWEAGCSMPRPGSKQSPGLDEGEDLLTERRWHQPGDSRTEKSWRGRPILGNMGPLAAKQARCAGRSISSCWGLELARKDQDDNTE